MKTLYCLSGLGVDESAFRTFTPKNTEIVHIPWIAPLKNESLSHYAHRLFELSDLPMDYALLGVSFGGMIAQEFAKIQAPQSLFLISTISSSGELPFLFKIGARLRIHTIIPSRLLTWTTPFTHFLFGTKERKDKLLLKEILAQTDPTFLKWAMNAITRWKNEVVISGIRIHGDKDRILPTKTNVDYLISNAGHFMIATHGEHVSSIVEKCISQQANATN